MSPRVEGPAPTCGARVYQGRTGFASCHNRATRDGWCGVHHPDAKAARTRRQDAARKLTKAEADARWKMRTAYDEAGQAVRKWDGTTTPEALRGLTRARRQLLAAIAAHDTAKAAREAAGLKPTRF